jgi:hypothetical protein
LSKQRPWWHQSGLPNLQQRATLQLLMLVLKGALTQVRVLAAAAAAAAAVWFQL